MKKLILLTILSTAAFAQNWSGILDPSRAADWTNAGAGTIPTRTTHCADLGVAGQASTYTQSVTSVQINSAIAACPSGQVVYLNPGTYAPASGIDFAGHNNVTLRGAGPNQTILNFTGYASCGGGSTYANICASNASPTWAGGTSVLYGTGSNTANWTAGFSQGVTQITLSTVTGLSVGMYIFLDQADDAADTNGHYVCQTNGPCAIDVPGGAGRSGRAQLEIKKITAIDTTNKIVTISPGLYNGNWRIGQNPGAWWVGTMLTGAGIEDMTINGNASAAVSNINFFNAAESWVENVKSLYGSRDHFRCYLSSRLTIRDSYLYGTKNNAEQSYGVENYGCADELLENNIAQHLPEIIVTDNTAGLVSAYNATYDHAFCATPPCTPPSGTWMQGGQRTHAAGTSFGLYEGNYDSGYTADEDHGTHNTDTSFRNYYTGWETAKTSQTTPVLLYTHSRGMNFIGNVLGTASYHTNYQNIYDGTTVPSSAQTTIWTVGFCANVGSISNTACGSMSNDALSGSTLMRWGNYDVVNNAVTWNTTEAQPGAATYINANTLSNPANHALPASFYLSAKPSWWGNTIPWPAIGPDVTTGDVMGTHAYSTASNPAQACYNSTSKDGNGILLFDANVCYYGSAPSTNRSIGGGRTLGSGHSIN